MSILPSKEFSTILRRLAVEVDRGASMEGTLRYEWSDEPGQLRVQMFCRTGNDMGQGGAMFVREDWPKPEDASLLEREQLRDETDGEP